MSHIETKNQTNELLAFESSLLAKTFFEQAMVTVGQHRTVAISDGAIVAAPKQPPRWPMPPRRSMPPS